MMKRVMSLGLSLALAISLAACSGSVSEAVSSASATAESTAAPEAEAPVTTFRIAGLKGPTTMGMVKLMSDAEAGETHQDLSLIHI